MPILFKSKQKANINETNINDSHKKDKIITTPTLTGLNILGHAQILELNLGSQCGGHGVCGKDRVLVSKSPKLYRLSALTSEEKEHLSESELAQGYRLACQCFIDLPDNETDPSIEIEIAYKSMY